VFRAALACRTALALAALAYAGAAYRQRQSVHTITIPSGLPIPTTKSPWSDEQNRQAREALERMSREPIQSTPVTIVSIHRKIPHPITKPGGIIVLQNEGGGEIFGHIVRFQSLGASNNQIEVRGLCTSACTLVASYVPREQLCFAEDAYLGFHQAWSRITKEPAPAATKSMFDSYPADIRGWLVAKGGLEQIPYSSFWVLPARDLWQMGYRRCAD
jgi:hypothetical protein